MYGSDPEVKPTTHQENKMPNQLKSGTHRVSYVESTTTSRALGIIAAAKGVTISALIREANIDYLAKHDPSGEITAVAKKIAESMSDSANDRVSDKIDVETAKLLGKIIKKFKK